jgi:hypothetical protein
MTVKQHLFGRSLMVAAISTALLGLSACGSLNSVRDVPEFFDSDLDSAPPREFITQKDISKIKVGMTPIQVRNRLGPPLLPESSTYARFDAFSFFNIFPRTDKRPNEPMVFNYVLRDTSSGKAEFVPYAVNFETTKTLGLFPSVGVKSFGALEKPVVANFDVPPTMAAPAATTAAVPEADPVVAKETPMAAPAADSATPTDDIVKAVQSWAQAWAGKDADAYVGFYTADFDHGMGSRGKWEAHRRQRLSNPQSITLSLSDIRITPKSDTTAEVSFRQEYSSNLFKENGQKTLFMSKADGQWKIKKEVFKKK